MYLSLFSMEFTTAGCSANVFLSLPLVLIMSGYIYNYHFLSRDSGIIMTSGVNSRAGILYWFCHFVYVSLKSQSVVLNKSLRGYSYHLGLMVCIGPKYYILRLGVLDEVVPVVHCWVSPQHKNRSTHLYTWMERQCGVMYLAPEHNTMTLARARVKHP